MGNRRTIRQIENEIATIEKRMAKLPEGYISKKNIRGREQLYLQWRDGKKVRSRYIKKDEREIVISQVSERQELNNRMDELRAEKNQIMIEELNDFGETARKIRSQMVAEEQSGYAAYTANGAMGTGDEIREIKHYLKWSDDTIGFVDSGNIVHFTQPEYNSTVRLYTAGSKEWSADQFESFLKDRTVSRERRDIEVLLKRMGLSRYNLFDVAAKTHMISAKDRMWLADSEDEKYEDAVTDVFKSVFHMNVDSEGESVDTPEGQNIKRYGVFAGEYGIYKKRLSPVITDAESELASYALAERMGVPCCRVKRVDEDTIFSVFEYDFNSEYIVHFRRLIENFRELIKEGRMPGAGSSGIRSAEPGAGRADDDLLSMLIAVRPEYLKNYAQMIAFDFLTRQDDRHLSNIAVKISENGESFYPLYDNGRCLFYEDTKETVEKACKDVRTFSTAFGHERSYFDHVERLSGAGISFVSIMNLDITPEEIGTILEQSGFEGYRLKGAQEWIMKCMELLKR